MLTTPMVFKRYHTIKSRSAQAHVVDKTYDAFSKQYRGDVRLLMESKFWKLGKLQSHGLGRTFSSLKLVFSED